jgi:DNA-binding transcriptional LysR family regulator
MAPAYEHMRPDCTTVQQPATSADVLRISMYMSIDGGPQFGEIVRTFGARHPGCRVQVSNAGSFDMALELRNAMADMITVRLPFTAPGVVMGPGLTSEVRVAVVSEDHPLAERESVDYDDIADYPVADHPTTPRDLAEAMAPTRTSRGRRIRRVVTDHTFSELVPLIAAGDLVHLTVASFLDHPDRSGVRAVPVRDLPPFRTALAWHAGREDVRIRAFADAALDIVGGLDRPPTPSS